MKVIDRLLRKNISNGRIIGFLISNLIGLAIVAGGLQFYEDARSLWDDEDSFIKSDYLVINKRITSSNTLGREDSSFSEKEIEEIKGEPWVRKVSGFTRADYRVWASMETNGRGMSTAMFFESIPDSFVDVARGDWRWDENQQEVPLIISKDYLTLYNFGFAAGAGLPQMSEGLMSGLPIMLTLRNESGTEEIRLPGRVAGYSNRLNTILVPSEFMTYTNQELGTGKEEAPSRLIIEVNSPGDVAIGEFMDSHDYEIAGDKSASAASFLLKVVVGIVLAIGIVITLLSLFILMLSVSLLMEKNKDKLHSLIMLGYPLRQISAPYIRIIVQVSVSAWLLALGALLILRSYYIEALRGLGASGGTVWLSFGVSLGLTVIIIIFNSMAVSRRVRNSFRIKS